MSVDQHGEVGRPRVASEIMHKTTSFEMDQASTREASQIDGCTQSSISFEIASYQQSIGRQSAGMDEVRQSMKLDGLSFEEARLQLFLNQMAQMNVNELGMPMDPKLFTFGQLPKEPKTHPYGELAAAAPPARWRQCFRLGRARQMAPRTEHPGSSDSFVGSEAFSWSMASSDLSDDGDLLSARSDSYLGSPSTTYVSTQPQDGSASATSSPFPWALSDRYH
jgi:hypothetical protein